MLYDLVCGCLILDCRFEGRCLCSICQCQKETPGVALTRFAPQIEMAAKGVQRKWRDLFPGREGLARLEEQAKEYLLIYAGPLRDGNKDGGKLREWMTTKPDDEQNALVYDALKKRLLTFAERTLAERCKEREMPVVNPATRHIKGETWSVFRDDSGNLSGYPTLAIYYRDDKPTQADVARELGVSRSTVQRRLKKELQQYMEDQGIAACDEVRDVFAGGDR